MAGKRVDPLRRFAEKIEIAKNGCWLWTGALKKGYAKLGAGGRGNGWVYAHRWAYEHFRGPIPLGLVLDHGCRTPRCVNPWCVSPCTSAENVLRGVSPRAQLAARLVHDCGRPFDEVVGGFRSCSECRKARMRQYHADIRDGRRTRVQRTA